MEDERIPLEEANGSYLENITFQSKEPQVVWTINDGHLATKWSGPSDPNFVLPSDCSLRPDLINIRLQEWKTAEDAKHTLEEL